ncbi:MAG: hypothetical protein WC055_00905 [Melioribacteraceae bacterium]
MLIITGVKTNNGYYISSDPNGDSTYYNNALNSYFINGERPETTFHKNWVFVKEEPITLYKLVKQPRINHRYELKSDLEFIDISSLPKILPKSEVMEQNNDYCEWKSEFKHLQGFYEELSDEQPDAEEQIEFTYKTILEIPDIKNLENYNNFRIENIQHQLLDKIVFPSIALPNQPCNLSSKESYEIVREYVKQNINGKYARVTSDYDFCFTVKKVVPLNDIIHNKIEIKKDNGTSYKNRKYKEKFIKDREIEVFDMTSDKDRYGKYTVLPGFEGKDHQDLKNNIDKYLSELITMINEPLKECPHCKGFGVIIEEIVGE